MSTTPDLTVVKPVKIDGDELLLQVHAALTKYVIFPTPEAAVAVTLYVAATHGQPAWDFATRLVAKSPVKRCGKSRLQEVLAELCHSPLRTANCSSAALVRSVTDNDPPTLLLDEADTVFGGAKGGKDGVAEDLRGLINSGFARGAPYIRWDMTTRQREECPTFAMTVLSGIGDLPDTIEDRAVVITLRRRGNGESVARFRQRQSIPVLHGLRDQMNEWVRANLDILRESEPAIPDGITDRVENVWESLYAVADLAGGTWPDHARRASIVLSAKIDAAADADSAGERLLADLAEVWPDDGDDQMFTRELLRNLYAIDEAH